MYICICVFLYICIFVHLYICISVYLYLCIYVYTYLLYSYMYIFSMYIQIIYIYIYIFFLAAPCLMNSFDIPYGLGTGCGRNPLPLVSYPAHELRMSCASFCGALRIYFLKEIFELDSDFILTYFFTGLWLTG